MNRGQKVKEEEKTKQKIGARARLKRYSNPMSWRRCGNFFWGTNCQRRKGVTWAAWNEKCREEEWGIEERRLKNQKEEKQKRWRFEEALWKRWWKEEEKGGETWWEEKPQQGGQNRKRRKEEEETEGWVCEAGVNLWHWFVNRMFVISFSWIVWIWRGSAARP